MRRTGLAFLEQERRHSGAHLEQRHPSVSWLSAPLPHLCADLCSESALARAGSDLILMERAWEESPWSPRETTCEKLTEAAAALTKVSFSVSVCSALALLSSGFNTFGAIPTMLLICHVRSEAL